MVDQEKIGMGGDCMSWVRKRHSRAKLGILFIVIGPLWYGQRTEWFPSEILGPLVLFTIGVWMVAVSSLRKKQTTSGERR